MRIEAKRGKAGKTKLIIQAMVGIWLILALAFHLAAVGINGLSVIVLLTAFNGVVEEQQMGCLSGGSALYRPLGGVFCHRRRYS